MRRWIRWNVRCRRGRRCAKLVVDECEMPEGVSLTVFLDYRCAACGTHYREEVLLTDAGAASGISLGRERVR
jgi:hypothetical protein